MNIFEACEAVKRCFRSVRITLVAMKFLIKKIKRPKYEGNKTHHKDRLAPALSVPDSCALVQNEIL